MLVKKRILSILIAMLLLAGNVSMVAAAPPAPIHIEVLEYPGDWETPEPFIASGEGVTKGLVCATGDVVDLSVTWNSASGPYLILWIDKQFTCDDMSGTFDVSMVVK